MLVILLNSQDQYQSFANTAANIKMLFKVIILLGLEPRSLLWETGALPVHYRNNMSLKLLLKLDKLTMKIL